MVNNGLITNLVANHRAFNAEFADWSPPRNSIQPLSTPEVTDIVHDTIRVLAGEIDLSLDQASMPTVFATYDLIHAKVTIGGAYHPTHNILGVHVDTLRNTHPDYDLGSVLGEESMHYLRHRAKAEANLSDSSDLAPAESIAVGEFFGFLGRRLLHKCIAVVGDATKHFFTKEPSFDHDAQAIFRESIEKTTPRSTFSKWLSRKLPGLYSTNISLIGHLNGYLSGSQVDLDIIQKDKGLIFLPDKDVFRKYVEPHL
jgi:hypothetical protein